MQLSTLLREWDTSFKPTNTGKMLIQPTIGPPELRHVPRRAYSCVIRAEQRLKEIPYL